LAEALGGGRRSKATALLVAIPAAVACGLVYPIREQHEDVVDVVDAGPSDEDVTSEGGWCDAHAPMAAYCDDFDEQMFITDGWSWYDEIGDAAFPTFDTLYRSAPRSGKITLLPTPRTCSAAQLRKTLNSVVRAHVALSVRADEPDGSPPWTDPPGGVFGLSLAGPKNYCVLLYQIAQFAEVGEAIYPADGGSKYANHPLPVGSTRGTWYDVVMDVDRSVTPPRLSVSVGGTPMLTGEKLDPACSGPGPATLELGVLCFKAPPAPLEVRYDNVVFDVTH
jgi:hypothetical protein